MPICWSGSAGGLEFGFGGLIGAGEVDEVGDCCCCDMKKSQVKRHEVTTSSAYGIQSVTYRECQKNHAAGVGGYAVDGCREFMASGEEGTGGALVCAACGCHRSFHRREMDTEVVCSERFASR